MWRLYQFVNPNLEARYRVLARKGFTIGMLRAHCVLVFASVVLDLALTTGLAVYMLAAMAATTFLLFALSFFLRFVKDNVLPIHAVFCALATNMYALLTYLEITNRPQDPVWRAMQRLEELGVGGDDLSMVQAYVWRTFGLWGVRDLLLRALSLWWCTSVLGLNYYTIPLGLFIATAILTLSFATPMVAIDDAAVAVFGVAVCILIVFTTASLLEQARRASFLAEHLLTQELQASQMADSVLNHMLKNTLADVAANLERFLAGEEEPGMLEACISCLRRGIRSCKERQTYLKLVGGDYLPVLNNVALRDFGAQLIAGRDVTGAFIDCTVLLDATLCMLVLENAISNAFKHGHPDQPDVRFVIADLSSTTRGLPVGHIRLRFSILNRANPLRPPLTEAAVAPLFGGHLHLRQNAVVPTLSDGIGLSHCALAAKVGGMRLSLQQSDDAVEFAVELDAPCAAPTHDAALSFIDHSQLTVHFPAGLQFFCIDDSEAARRLVEFQIRRWCEPQAVRCYGGSEGDVSVFVEHARREADVVIMDQHLEYSRTYYGTDLAKELRNQGFSGLICIRSANDSPEDRANYARCGAHCSFGKDMLGNAMVEQLKAAYVELKGLHLPEEHALSSIGSHAANAGAPPVEMHTFDCLSADGALARIV